jgi:hypothetical protein
VEELFWKRLWTCRLTDYWWWWLSTTGPATETSSCPLPHHHHFYHHQKLSVEDFEIQDTVYGCMTYSYNTLSLCIKWVVGFWTVSVSGLAVTLSVPGKATNKIMLPVIWSVRTYVYRPMCVWLRRVKVVESGAKTLTPLPAGWRTDNTGRPCWMWEMRFWFSAAKSLCSFARLRKKCVVNLARYWKLLRPRHSHVCPSSASIITRRYTNLRI